MNSLSKSRIIPLNPGVQALCVLLLQEMKYRAGMDSQSVFLKFMQDR